MTVVSCLPMEGLPRTAAPVSWEQCRRSQATPLMQTGNREPRVRWEEPGRRDPINRQVGTTEITE